jgi:mono/diheme cytochrome c family protein
LWSAAVSVAALGQAAPAAGKTVNDGVYTTAQAERGLKIYSASCGICHDTGRFSDDKFFTDWSGKPLQQLFDLISTTMPEDNPGGLKPQEYTDVVAYLLSVNRFAAGPNELTPGPAGMGGITIVKPASKGQR